MIIRKVTAPVLFDETPVGLRRRRTMIEAAQRLESVVAALAGDRPGATPPTLDTICAVAYHDYQTFRYSDQAWLPATPGLKALSEAMRARPSFQRTVPHA